MPDLDASLTPLELPADSWAEDGLAASVGEINQASSSEPEPASWPKAASAAFPGLGGALLLWLLFEAVTLSVVMVCFALRLRMDWYSQMLLRVAIAWPLVLRAGVRRSGVPFRDAVPQGSFSASIIPPLLLGSFGAAIMLRHLASVVDVPWFRGALSLGIPSDYWISAFLGAVVVAPVAEEMFFRGLVLRGFVARYSPFHAVWLSALLFAMCHMNVWQFVFTFPLGMVNAWLVLRTGSVVPGIVSHATINFTSTLLMVPMLEAFGHGVAARHELAGRSPPLILMLGVLMAAGGGYFVWRELAASSVRAGETLDSERESS